MEGLGLQPGPPGPGRGWLWKERMPQGHSQPDGTCLGLEEARVGDDWAGHLEGSRLPPYSRHPLSGWRGV